MKKYQKKLPKAGTDSDKKESNAGSASFNQGAAQDPSYDDGIPVSDEEKKTGHIPNPARPKK